MAHFGDPSDTLTNLFPLPRARRAEDFFVAGGPVAPDRACYIARSTDQELLERARAGDYCHVIAPRFSGKSSLVARAASRLRAEGRLAAVIDLSQLGGRDGTTEIGRWYYALAYRVLRDLRLKFDLQNWWQERMPLPPAQRLGEFFWEAVLSGTQSTVTVFLDEIDGVEQLDHATELFGLVRACHDARAGEPEYKRLAFVMLGASLPVGAAERAGLAAAEISVRLELPDFRFDEARPLAEGLGLPSGDADRALYRVLYWTGGHPYLTQKLCQAIGRNPSHVDSDDAVDQLVAARFFARNVVTRETSMSRVLDTLDRAGKLARPALRLYRRIHRGRRPRYEPGNPQHELLRVCGLVTVSAERRLEVRNRIYAEVFSHHWARDALSMEWGRIGRLAAVLGLAVGAVWAYVEVLPRPYEETLRVASVEMDEALEAWSSMRSIPGFSGRANRLLARVLTRASRLAESWPAVEAIDAQLRALPGYQARADALQVAFWERQAAAAEAAERRDEALLYRLRAYVAGPTADAGRAAELAGGGYGQLRTVIRPAGVVKAVAPTADGQGVVTVSAGNILERWSAVTGLPEPGGRTSLLSEEFVPVRRRLSLDARGQVARATVELRLDHPRPEDLHIQLTAPSGRTVVLPPAQAEIRGGSLAFDETRAPGLRALRGEQALGTWLLEIEDRGNGDLGRIAGWTLTVSPAAGHRAEDRPENALLLPGPNPSSAVQAALSPRGSIAAALPANPEARGMLRTWDTASSRALAAVEVGAGERWIGFADDVTLVLVEQDGAGEWVRILDAVTGAVRSVQRAEGRFAAGPAVSPDGRHLAAVEARAASAWIRELETGREVFRLPASGEPSVVAVASGGLLLAIADRGGVVRVWHGTDGALLAEFPQDTPVTALAFDPSGRWLAVADVNRHVSVRDLTRPELAPVLSRPGGALPQFAFDAAGRRFVTLSAGGGYEVWGLPDGTPRAPILPHEESRTAAAGSAARLGFASLSLGEDGWLVGGRGTRSVRTWDVRQEVAPADLPRIAPVVALAPSGLRMGAGLADGRVVLRMRDPESLRLQQTLITTGDARHGGGVTALDFSPDGRRLVSVGADGSVMLWDTATGAPIGGLFQHGSGRVADVELGADGRRLVTAGELGARVWDAETGTAGPLLGPGRQVSAVALDPAGRRAFTGTPEGEVEIWDAASGERLWFGSMDAPVSTLAVSGDGLRLAAASGTGMVHVWGLGPGGRPLSRVLAGPVIGLQFSPDGMTVLAQTASWLHRLAVVDGRLRVIDSRLLPAAVPPGAWRSASPGGSRIVLVSGAQSESMDVLDFDRASLPPDDWVPDLYAWQRKLKLYFTPDGELRTGVQTEPAAAQSVASAEEATGL
jgi:WD40 repeat protein